MAESLTIEGSSWRRFWSFLAEVQNPSFISPFWTARASEQFEDAPIRVVQYSDLLCPDCLFLYKQLKQLENWVETRPKKKPAPPPQPKK